MKCVFLVHRTNYYRFFVPLIEESLNRGYQVECWHDKRGEYAKGSKSYTVPSAAALPHFCGTLQPTEKTFSSLEELERMIEALSSHDFIVSLHHSFFICPRGLSSGCKPQWVTLMVGGDSFIELERVTQQASAYRIQEIFLIHSMFWLQKGTTYFERYYPEGKKLLDEEFIKYFAIGNPEMDAFKDISQETVRKKYGIPQKKSILLYLPYPYARISPVEEAFCGMNTNTAVDSQGRYLHDKKQPVYQRIRHYLRVVSRIVSHREAWRLYRQGITEARMMDAVRAFCDRNDLFLVVKPRLKYPVAEPVKQKADLVIWDDELPQNPPILKELLSVAKMTTSFFSSTVLTSIFANVPHLTFSLPDAFFHGDKHRFWFTEDQPSIYDFPKVCTRWSFERAIQELGSTPLAYFDIDLTQRKAYIEKFIGEDDFHASKRFFDTVETYGDRRKEHVHS